MSRKPSRGVINIRGAVTGKQGKLTGIRFLPAGEIAGLPLSMPACVILLRHGGQGYMRLGRYVDGG
jgi:hypothetical protein